LPEHPTETQVATLLDMAARSGNATGAALYNNRVVMGVPTAGGNLELLRTRDVLAVSGMAQHDFNQALLSSSPFTSHDNTLGVREPTTWQKLQRWLAGDWTSDGVDADRYFSSNEAWRGFVSFRSPWNSDRLVVMALGSNDDQLSRLHEDLTSARINAGIPDFEAALKAAKVEYQLYMYEGAGHAFNNDSNPERYNKEAADLAWGRTIEFFKKKLK